MNGADGEFRADRFRGEAAEELIDAVRGSGLVSSGDRGLVMVSGGADSVALLLALNAILGPGALTVLHVNYGLREAADNEEDLVRRICRGLGVRTAFLRAGTPAGNTQDWARRIRHDEAERIRAERGLDWVAVGHNRSDVAETFLYRLVVSPGVRPLLAMPARTGRIIRPLLALDRNRIRELLAGMAPFAVDPTNEDPAFARGRIRHRVLPELEKVNPAAELNIVRTRAELEEDEEALVDLAGSALERGMLRPDLGLEGTVLANESPAVRRRMLRLLAERRLGRPVAVTAGLAASAVRLLGSTEGGELDLGGGDSLVIEAGRLRVRARGESVTEEAPAPTRVAPDSGPVNFGGWEFTSSRTTEDEARGGFGNPWVAFLDDAAEPQLDLRPWQSGDRVEPLGMGGTKKLQDVFTDALVPASRRGNWPVLVTGETVIWVPGLVRSRHFLIGHPDQPVLRLEADPPSNIERRRV